MAESTTALRNGRPPDAIDVAKANIPYICGSVCREERRISIGFGWGHRENDG